MCGACSKRRYTGVDDRPDMQEYLDSLAPEQREEIRGFLRRFEDQIRYKEVQLLNEFNELEDRGRLSEQDHELRNRMLDGYVPLIDDDGELIYRKREELTLEDMRRFGAFMDRDRERREREIGDLGDSSEN
jgi:hypothetical protein